MKILKRKTFAALLALSLLASLLPLGAQPALAADGDTVYVGGVALMCSTGSPAYATTDTSGNVSSDGSESNYNIKWDGSTLTLNGAKIKGADSSESLSATVGIYAFNNSGGVSLNIALKGVNEIFDSSHGIWVYSSSTNAGNATLTIEGEGSLNASGGTNGIQVQSNSGNAALTIRNADVTAENSIYSGDGVTVRAGSSSSASLSVDGGSLTATGTGVGSGINFLFGSGVSGSGMPSLTVSGNTIVRANGGISDNSSTDIQIGEGDNSSGGIVFDGNKGTVYGNVTLQEDLTIGEGESLTIPEGSSLNCDGKLTNNGTILASGGTVSGNLSDGKEVTTPSISDQPTNQTVTEGSAAEFSVTASDAQTYQWQQSTDNGSSWTNIESATSAKYTTEATTTSMSGYQYRCVVKSASGVSVISNAATLTVQAKPAPVSVTGVSLDKATLELYTGDTATLTATVEPDNATNKAVTWESSDNTVATVDNNGNVTAVKAGTATITATAADGSGVYATCTVTVNQSTYSISADTTALNFGSVYTGYAQPAAQTVTLTNTGNQQVTVTLPTANDFIITAGTGFTDGSAAIKPGDTATFTVQPKTGLSAGTYNETIEVTGTEGAAVTIPASFTVKSRPSYNPPTVSEEATDAIKAADPGETVTVDLSHGSTKLGKEVFETLAGQDITLVIDLGDGVSWTVKGSDVPEDADFTDIDMGVTMNSDGIPVDVVNAITGERSSVQLELAHDGAFGFTMTLTAPLGAENAGYWANLYHFNEEASTMTFETAAPIGSDGSVSLAFSHASQYAIVIDDHNHGVIELPFTDVADSDWFYDPVCFVYSQGLMTGTSATMFEPNTHLSRAMLVAVLHRLEGSPAASGSDFTDVADGDWYAQAVNWAASVGVVNGFDDGTFQPNTAITREQLAAILMNYAQYKGQDVSARATLDTYNDATAISGWANDVMSWAVAEGLLTGVTNDQLQPQGNATRAQVAAILERFLAE